MKELILPIILACISGIFSSSGLWAFIMANRERKAAAKQDKETKIDDIANAVRGFGHDKILYLGQSYLDRGYITATEYDNLINYIWIPYDKLEGNGTAKKIIEEVKKLPIKN